MESNFKPIGDFIRRVDKRNKDLSVTDLRGLSMTKEFRKTTSNIIGTDMSNYKVVNKNQFACDFMSVIRVYKLPVVLHTEDDPIIVSPAYPVFEVIDENVLLPEYLMMWMRRSEFDRYAFFRCDSAIRGGFGWDELCEVKIPVPDIKIQKEIVKEYNTIINRIELNNQLIQKLEETAQTIYKQWFVDFEFPDENGNPYKSSGGEMEYYEELDMEIPKGWNISSLSKIATYLNGFAMQKYPSLDENSFIPILKIRELNQGFTDEKSDKGSLDIPKKYFIRDGDVIFSWSGTLLVDLWCGGLSALNQHLFKVSSNNYNKWFYYLWTKDHLAEFIRFADGRKTSMGHIKRENLEQAKVLVPTDKTLIKMNLIMSPLFEFLIQHKKEKIQLLNLRETILSKMSKINTIEVLTK
jgi:type I restriction enzyme, S subunit